jgi:hypothetical protein
MLGSNKSVAKTIAQAAVLPVQVTLGAAALALLMAGGVLVVVNVYISKKVEQ